MEKEELKWTTLSPVERENYIGFHKKAYADDLSTSDELVLKHPRWSIISGYYAMHDITKLFLAEKFAIKISSPNIHEKAISALREKIQDTKTKDKLLKLLKEAKELYFNAERLKEKVIPELLRKGRQERGKSQYYTEDYTSEKQANAQKASYFLENFAKPYIKIMEGMLNAS